MDHQALRRAVLPTAAAMLLLLLPELTGASVRAQPDYPRVNVATGYEIDPDWPRRPDNMPWASMPGVFVDGKDQVWLFTRANPPVQVYDAKGNFVRAWGDGLVGSAHHIRRDHEGNVWLADYGDHVILKCSPEGKVLMVLGTKGEPGDDESSPTVTTMLASCISIRTAISSRVGAHSAPVRASSAWFMPSRSTPRAASMWPTATTSASRSSTRAASCWTNGGT